AQRVALVISQTQAPNKKALVHRPDHDVWRDGVEPQLRAAEQLEGVGGVDGAPREVDEPGTRTALDVTAAEVEAGIGGDRHAVGGPGRRRRICGGEAEHIIPAVAALHADMHVVVATRTVRTGSAADPGKVDTLNPDLHTSSIRYQQSC